MKHACFRQCFCAFFYTIWVLGAGRGRSPKGLVHNLLLQFFTLGSSKKEVSETYFSDTVTTYNDHRSYVKHSLGRIYVFFTCSLLKEDSLRGGLAKGNNIFGRNLSSGGFGIKFS